MSDQSQPHLYFYSHTGKLGYLSNFYRCEFNVDGQWYNSSEQYFMKKKQETFDADNNDLSAMILAEKNPSIVKKYGRMVNNYDDQVWNDLRYGIMLEALKHKFSGNIHLRVNLSETKPLMLVEASPVDRIWGIGITREQAISGVEWRGQNLLGQCLMEVREWLRYAP